MPGQFLLSACIPGWAHGMKGIAWRKTASGPAEWDAHHASPVPSWRLTPPAKTSCSKVTRKGNYQMTRTLLNLPWLFSPWEHRLPTSPATIPSPFFRDEVGHSVGIMSLSHATLPTPQAAHSLGSPTPGRPRRHHQGAEHGQGCLLPRGAGPFALSAHPWLWEEQPWGLPACPHRSVTATQGQHGPPHRHGPSTGALLLGDKRLGTAEGSGWAEVLLYLPARASSRMLGYLGNGG